MKFRFLLLFLSVFIYSLYSQNDEDVIRYSNLRIGGTTRFLGMSGAMGALGGDMSCASYNPAGLGIMLRSDLNFSFGLHFANTISEFNQSTTKKLSPALTFNFIGISGTGASNKNINNRGTFAITLNQMQNFNQNIAIKGRPTRGKSITLDMLNYAKGKYYTYLDMLYEGAAYYTYVIDMIDTNNVNSYFSFVDTSKSFTQSQKITKSGRINELNFSYAYSFDDKIYLGATLSVPFLKFSYKSDYAEIDDLNQMQIAMNPDSSISSTYSYPVLYYPELGGLKDFHYQTTYTTTATGINIKIGAILRLTDYLRLGLYYHSPTWYKAKDTYYYSFISNWDTDYNIAITVPDGGGYYNYRIITPSKAGIALSGIISNRMSINADYELLDYRSGLLKSSDMGVFDNANKALKEKYNWSGNLRFGIELNTKPLMFRIGWASFGSPFGQQFSGNYVKNTFSVGCGFKTETFYFDFAISKTFSGKQEYYMYNPQYADPANIRLNLTQIIFTIGLIGQRYDENINYAEYNVNPNNQNTPTPPNQPNKPVIPY